MRRRVTAGALTATAALALALSACGSSTPAPEVGAGPDGASPDAPDAGEDATGASVDLPACPPWDAPRNYDPPPEEQPTPDAALTTANVNPDLPTEDGDGDPSPGEQGGLLGQVRDWAERAAPDHFAGIWLDDEHGATVVAFTEDVDRYAEEVRERFGRGWWVVEGEHAHAELERAQQRVIARMGGGRSGGGGGTGDVGTPPGSVVGTGLREDVQRVTVDVVGGDDVALAELAEELDHPAICFEVLDPPPSYEPDGPVRTLATVPGWREELPGVADGTLEIAYDRDTAERAFAENVPDDLLTDARHVAEDGLHAGLETVDWEREVLVVWSAGRSGSCPVWVEDLRSDGGRIALDIASPSQGTCTMDFNPYRAVLAVARDRLPPAADLPVPVGRETGVEAVAYPAGGS